MSELPREPIITDRIVTIAVDVQRDFMHGGSLAVPHGEDVITPLNNVMTYTRENGGDVIATRDWHPTSTPHFDTWPVHCVQDTRGAEFHPHLNIHRGDAVVSKGQGQTDGYSGFEGETNHRETLEELVQPTHRKRHVTVLIGGVATGYCILNTVRDGLAIAKQARKRGAGVIDIVLIQDAIRPVNRKDGNRAIREMLRAKALALTSEEILDGAVRTEA